MYLLFDTETTGLPLNWKAPLEDLKNWPRLVQFAWVELDRRGKVVSQGDYLVRPRGFEIPAESTKIHKITHSRAMEEGEELLPVLGVINALIERNEYLVAHNMEYDQMVLGAEFLREYIKTSLFEKKRICTMQQSTEFCKIPGRTGLKPPSLAELHYKLFRENFEEAHNAAVDIMITAKCFRELLAQGAIDLNKSLGTTEKAATQVPEAKEENISLF